MKERPILFSGPMIRAILRGEKTQTRRVMPVQPLAYTGRKYIIPDDAPKRWTRDDIDDIRDLCPYGRIGDRLWVRETWALVSPDEHERPANECNIEYRADTNAVAPGDWGAVDKEDRPEYARWRPSIHMPRRYSRITLKVTDVRVQRLHEIDEHDAEAEGVCNGLHDFDCHNINGDAYHCACGSRSYRDVFERLWTSINGTDSWAANPWVYALTFEVEKAASSAAGLKSAEGAMRSKLSIDQVA